jgi:hypothetical protein
VNERTLLLERFHVALVASIERANPAYLREPFTVREIHEELIPYRTHRDLIGVAMNGDYEDGLMRLLAGEGDYLILESPEALTALQEELSGKAPDTGLFKEFPEAVVRLNPAQLGGTQPVEPRRGVAGLFKSRDEDHPDAEEERGPSASSAPARGPSGTNGWKLGDEDSPADPSRSRRTAGSVSGTPKGSDEVEKPGQFWSDTESSARHEPSAAERSSPMGTGDSTEALEAENRRLKILLAERVLEVEELRERLNQQGSRGRREKP